MIACSCGTDGWVRLEDGTFELSPTYALSVLSGVSFRGPVAVVELACLFWAVEEFEFEFGIGLRANTVCVELHHTLLLSTVCIPEWSVH